MLNVFRGKLLYYKPCFSGRSTIWNRFKITSRSLHTPTPSNIKGTAKRLFKIGKPEHPLLCAGIVALLIGSTVSLIIPKKVGEITQILSESLKQNDLNNTKNQLLKSVLGVGSLLVAGGIAVTARNSILQTAAHRVTARIRNSVFNHIMKQELSWFDKKKTSDLSFRLNADSKGICDNLTLTVANGIRSLVEIIGSVSLLYMLSPKIAAFTMISVVPLSFVVYLFGRLVRNMYKKYNISLSQASEKARETFNNIHTVKALSREEKELQEYSLKVDEVYKLGKKFDMRNQLYLTSTELATYVCMLGILMYGGLSVIAGEVSVSALTQILMYGAYIGNALYNISEARTNFMKVMFSSERVFEVIDNVSQHEVTRGKKLEQIVGTIEFHNVSFSDERNIPVFEDFTVKLEPGKITAITGISGSAIAFLLTKIYKPSKGYITLDGNDIRDLDTIWLRQHIGVIPQEPTFFSCSIEENILFGCEKSVSREDIIKICKKLDIDDFIKTLSHGYGTNIERVLLSHEQRQKIALARAFIKKPKILILDDPSTDMESPNDLIFLNAVKEFAKDTTVVIISHRKSIIQRADKIIHFHQGKTETQ